MNEKFKAYWESLSSKQKRAVVVGGIAIALVGASLMAYGGKGKKAGEEVKEEKGQVIQIGLDESHLQKSAYLESQKQMDTLKKELDAIKTGKVDEKLELDKNATPEQQAAAKMNEIGKGNPLLQSADKNAGAAGRVNPEADELRKQLAELKAEKESESRQLATRQQKLPRVPNVPLPAPGSSQLPPAPMGPPNQFPAQQQPQQPQQPAAPVEKLEEKTIGAIALTSNTIKDEKKEKEAADKKKDNRIYLPPSFMAATILSGLDAPVTSGGKGGPVPVLLRIKDLSILPNKVKANLKGCFVIAEGLGNLSSERAELRLVNISCLDRKGQSLIDQSLSGFVVDTDGKIGLRGRVVAAKLGSNIARMLMAGFLGGVGDALKQSTQTITTNALGTTQATLADLDISKLGQAGIGQGLSSAVGELQKFYLELARQSMPVIEIGATRDVTLVVSKGIELEIKDINKGRD